MKSYKVKNLYFLRLEEGEEIVSSLKEKLSKIKGAAINGIGAVSKAKVAVFDPQRGKYNIREIKGFHEVASLLGNLSRDKEGNVALHLHIVLASRKEVVAGHLIEAYVKPTLEVAVFELNKELKRTVEAKGLKLLDV